MLGLALIVVVWAILIAFFFVLLPYLYARLYHRSRGWCPPFQHDWSVTKVSVGLLDSWSKGELWRCSKCDKVRAL